MIKNSFLGKLPPQHSNFECSGGSPRYIHSDCLRSRALELYAADLVIGLNSRESRDFHPVDSTRHELPSLVKQSLEILATPFGGVPEHISEELLHDLRDLTGCDPQLNVDRLGEVSIHKRFCFNVDAKTCVWSFPIGGTC